MPQTQTMLPIPGDNHFFRRSFEAVRYLARGQLRELWDSNRRRETARRELLSLLPVGSVGAELGVFKGEFSAEILRQVQPKELHLVDGWWERFGDFYPNWGEYTNHGRLRTQIAYAEAHCNVAMANEDDLSTVIFSVGDDLTFLSNRPKGYFDWIYIDSDHSFAHVASLLTLAASAIRRDGLICGDDWEADPNNSHSGVMLAVTEFLKQNPDFKLKYLRGGQWMIGSVQHEIR